MRCIEIINLPMEYSGLRVNVIIFAWYLWVSSLITNKNHFGVAEHLIKLLVVFKVLNGGKVEKTFPMEWLFSAWVDNLVYIRLLSRYYVV